MSYNFKSQQKKAKKYVRDEVREIENSVTDSLETRVQKADTEFNALMERSMEELQIIEHEKKRITSSSVAKQRLVALYVTGDYTQSQLARILKVHTSTIHTWLHDEEVLNAISKYQREEDIVISNSLKALRMKALNTMNELMDSQNDLVALNAAKDVLDRTGHSATQKQEVNVNVSYEERLNQLVEGVVIEVEPKEDSNEVSV